MKIKLPGVGQLGLPGFVEYFLYYCFIIVMSFSFFLYFKTLMLWALNFHWSYIKYIAYTRRHYKSLKNNVFIIAYYLVKHFVIVCFDL